MAGCHAATMNLRRNILAGMASSVWSALLGLAVIPLYIKYLGIEAYGLIGFFVTGQTLLSLLDMGLAPTINREMARCSAAGRIEEGKRLLHTLAVVYWLIAICIALLLFAISSLVVDHWLQIRGLDRNEAQRAVVLMGCVIGFRWPVALYQGALMGLQRLTVTSAVSMASSTLANIGAVIVLVYVSATLSAFFIWQAAVAFLYVLAMRHFAWKAVGTDPVPKFDLPALKHIWRFSAGMSGVAITSLAFTQLDKVLLSKFLDLEHFGRYALAGVAASGLYVLLTPVFNAVYPRMSAMVARHELQALLTFYKEGTLRLCCALFPLVIFAVFRSEELLYAWTGNASLAKDSAPLFSLILVGTALNGVMHFPYALQLSSGLSRLPLTINGILIVAMVPVTVVLSLSFGAIGGAVSWVVLNFLYVLLGTWMTHRILLVSEGLAWLARDVGVPAAVSTVVVGFGLFMLPDSGNMAVNLAAGFIVMLLGVLLNLLLLSGGAAADGRQRLRKKLRILTPNERAESKGSVDLAQQQAATCLDAAAQPTTKA